MNTSKLLINENPLQVLPSLAVAIGLNEAMVLQQLHYWITTIGNENDGRKWIYNSYPEWQKQFPFWSYNTIKRTITSLEKQGILISGNYNKISLDRTKWYAIDYDKLNELTNSSISTDHQPKMSRPIPENTPEIKEINKEKTSKNSLTPCTSQELWDIAWEMSVPLEDVDTTHASILDSIEGKEFKHKTVYFTLKNWIRLGIQRGSIQKLSDNEKSYLKDFDPKRVEWKESLVNSLDAQL